MHSAAWSERNEAASDILKLHSHIWHSMALFSNKLFKCRNYSDRQCVPGKSLMHCSIHDVCTTVHFPASSTISICHGAPHRFNGTPCACNRFNRHIAAVENFCIMANKQHRAGALPNKEINWQVPLPPCCSLPPCRPWSSPRNPPCLVQDKKQCYRPSGLDACILQMLA